MISKLILRGMSATVPGCLPEDGQTHLTLLKPPLSGVKTRYFGFLLGRPNGDLKELSLSPWLQVEKHEFDST